MEEETQQPINLEEAFNSLIGTSNNVGGDEELLKIAGKHTLQLTAKQIRCLLWLKMWAKEFEFKKEGDILTAFIDDFILWKSYNNSQEFIMTALDNISLRRFITQNSLKINIDKST